MPKPLQRISYPRRESTIFLEDWLEYRKMTAEQLAGRMETSKSVVSKLANGKQRYNQDWLERIAFVLDCEVRDLYRPPSAKLALENARRVLNDIEPEVP